MARRGGHDVAGLGPVWRSRCGVAWLDQVRQDVARLGCARFGAAVSVRQGLACRGTARKG